MIGVKRKYIEAAYTLLKRDGLEGVSTRKVADEIGCSSAALYRHFPDIEKLTTIASVRFLRDYISNARILSKVELNPLELNLQLWECLAFYSFQDADVFANMFFGDATGARYAEAVAEYFEQYPEDLEGLKDFMLDMVRNATIAERDAILLNRAAEMGMLSEESADYLCKVDTLLFRGMLTSLCGRTLNEDAFRESAREFMRLMIHSYLTQLEDGYSILVVSQDDELPEPSRFAGERPSYRAKVISVTCDSTKRTKKKATA